VFRHLPHINCLLPSSFPSTFFLVYGVLVFSRQIACFQLVDKALAPDLEARFPFLAWIFSTTFPLAGASRSKTDRLILISTRLPLPEGVFSGRGPPFLPYNFKWLMSPILRTSTSVLVESSPLPMPCVSSIDPPVRRVS